MGGIEATDGEFRARAGTLTLLFMTSEESRENLLDMLEQALQGGLLGEVDEAELEEHLEERGRERSAEGPMARVDPDQFIGPHSSMKTTSKGELFLAVGLVLERWLRNCPDGPLRIGPEGADPLAALVCCWSATVTHAFAGEPLTLPELAQAVPLDYETTVEHLEALLRNGLAAPQKQRGRDALRADRRGCGKASRRSPRRRGPRPFSPRKTWTLPTSSTSRPPSS